MFVSVVPETQSDLYTHRNHSLQDRQTALMRYVLYCTGLDLHLWRCKKQCIIYCNMHITTDIVQLFIIMHHYTYTWSHKNNIINEWILAVCINNNAQDLPCIGDVSLYCISAWMYWLTKKSQALHYKHMLNAKQSMFYPFCKRYAFSIHFAKGIYLSGHYLLSTLTQNTRQKTRRDISPDQFRGMQTRVRSSWPQALRFWGLLFSWQLPLS